MPKCNGFPIPNVNMLWLTFPEFFSFVRKPDISLKPAASMTQFVTCSICLYPLKLLNNFSSWKTYSRTLNWTLGLTNGITSGAVQSSHPKEPTVISLEQAILIQLQMDLDIFLSAQSQGFLLAPLNRILYANDHEETVEHLFLHCDLTKSCWGLIGVTVNSAFNPFQIFEDFRRQLNVSFFMEVIIVMSWSIWTIRNDAIFRGIPPSTFRCSEIFRFTFSHLLWRAKKKYFPAIEVWLQQVM